MASSLHCNYDVSQMNGPNSTHDLVSEPVTAAMPFQSALSANLDYASSLRKQLNELRHQLQSNLEKQRLLKSHQRERTWLKYSAQRRCTILRRGKFFAMPHFMYKMHRVKNTKTNDYFVAEPPMNRDTKHWRNKSKIAAPSHCTDKQDEFQSYVPVFNPHKTLTKIEKNIIITSARCEYIEKAKLKLSNHNNNRNRNVNAQNKLRHQLMELDTCNPIEIDCALLDWKRITKYWIDKHKGKVSTDVSMVKHRHPSEYQRIWKNYILCDNSSWGRKEIKCLKQIVKRYGGYNWIAIHKEFTEECRAQNIDKKRSILTIIRYYQQCVNPIHTKHEWTRKEDEILIYVSKKYGENDTMTQSYYLECRPPAQCYARLQHASSGKGDRDSIWSEKEDLVMLLALKSQKNIKWNFVSRFLANKNDSQCRQRWIGVLKHMVWNGASNDRMKLNVEQIIFIMNILARDKDRLWGQWSDIAYVLNCFEYNYWDKAWHECKMKLDPIEKSLATEKGRKRKRPNLELGKWKKDMLINCRYVDPSAIAALFCVIYGGKSGQKLFCDEEYCRSLLDLFHDLKRLAMQCQRSGGEGEEEKKRMLQEIDEYKNKIGALVDNGRFLFDESIEHVVESTVYFDDSMDSMQNYRRSAKIKANRNN